MATFSLTSANGGALTRGTDYSFGISVTDTSSGSPAPVDLTGYAASVVLLRGPGADVLATFTTTGSDSSITASLAHGVTAALPLPIPDDTGLRTAWVKILLTRPDGSVLPGGEGPLEILP